MIFKIDCWVREIAILISCDEYDKGNRVGEGGGGGWKLRPLGFVTRSSPPTPPPNVTKDYERLRGWLPSLSLLKKLSEALTLSL